jgi:hypothetical protein
MRKRCRLSLSEREEDRPNQTSWTWTFPRRSPRSVVLLRHLYNSEEVIVKSTQQRNRNKKNSILKFECVPAASHVGKNDGEANVRNAGEREKFKKYRLWAIN